MATQNKSPTPNLLTAAGDVGFPHQTLGIVIATVVREEAGCGGGLPVNQALYDATDDLKRQTHEMGGNAVIHIQYMHRMSSTPGCGNTAKQNIEVYAWGTAIKY